MGFEELMLRLGPEEREELARRQAQFLRGQFKILGELDSSISSKETTIQKTRDALVKTYEPNGRNGFLEAEGFEGFTTLQFFYETGKFLERAFSPTLARLPKIGNDARKVSRDGNGDTDRGGLSLVNMLDDAQNTVEVVQQVCEVREKGVFPFEKVVKHVYQRSIDQFKYLQKRFLNIGGEDSRAYRNPWDNDEKKGGFDLARIPYVKTELIRDSALFTDLLLDISEQLPREHTRKEKIKGKRKHKEVKFLDEFDVDRTARILVEVANPQYQAYVKDPHSFMTKVSRSIGDYFEIMSLIDPKLRDLLAEQDNNPLARVDLNPEVLRRNMPDPSAIISRLNGISYNSVRPNEEDVRPSSQLERRHFGARRVLMEHLSQSIDDISRAQSWDEKFGIAKSAVERGVKLKEKVREALETNQSRRIKSDKKSDNEFYIGTSSGHGEFGFERE